MTFENMNLIEPILRSLKQEGYTVPTPIQAQAIPQILENRDILGCAQTGTGKTAAFVLPILQRLFLEKTAPQTRMAIKTLILTPTRELAVQIDESIAAYGRHLPIRKTVIFGGVSQFHQVSALRRGVDIVTATPGTTRDLVTETVAIGGIPVKLVDTAGMRRALDEAESIGIRKSMEALADADLVLVVLDASQAVASEDEELLKHVEDRVAIVVVNKSDLGSSQLSVLRSQDPRFPIVLTSALTGEGIAALRTEILRHISGNAGVQGESGFLTNVRHQKLVQDALAALDAAKTAVANRIPHEMLLLDLYSALRPLDEITGATTTDDILNLIFGTFCIGK